MESQFIPVIPDTEKASSHNEHLIRALLNNKPWEASPASTFASLGREYASITYFNDKKLFEDTDERDDQQISDGIISNLAYTHKNITDYIQDYARTFSMLSQNCTQQYLLNKGKNFTFRKIRNDFIEDTEQSVTFVERFLICDAEEKAIAVIETQSHIALNEDEAVTHTLERNSVHLLDKSNKELFDKQNTYTLKNNLSVEKINEYLDGGIQTKILNAMKEITVRKLETFTEHLFHHFTVENCEAAMRYALRLTSSTLFHHKEIQKKSSELIYDLISLIKANTSLEQNKTIQERYRDNPKILQKHSDQADEYILPEDLSDDSIDVEERAAERKLETLRKGVENADNLISTQNFIELQTKLTSTHDFIKLQFENACLQLQQTLADEKNNLDKQELSTAINAALTLVTRADNNDLSIDKINCLSTCLKGMENLLRDPQGQDPISHQSYSAMHMANVAQFRAHFPEASSKSSWKNIFLAAMLVVGALTLMGISAAILFFTCGGAGPLSAAGFGIAGLMISMAAIKTTAIVVSSVGLFAGAGMIATGMVMATGIANKESKGALDSVTSKANAFRANHI